MISITNVKVTTSKTFINLLKRLHLYSKGLIFLQDLDIMQICTISVHFKQDNYQHKREFFAQIVSIVWIELMSHKLKYACKQSVWFWIRLNQWFMKSMARFTSLRIWIQSRWFTKMWICCGLVMVILFQYSILALKLIIQE